MQKKIIPFTICIALINGCTDSQNNNSAVEIKPPVIESVTAKEISRQPIPINYSSSGYTQSNETISISTYVSSRIQKISADEGDIVKKNDSLITLDDDEISYQIQLAKNQIKTAKISYEDSLEDLKNAKRLDKSSMIADNELRKAKVNVDLAQNRIKDSQSELKRLQTKLSYFHLSSPIDARVIKRYVHSGDTTSIGKSLLELESLNKIQFVTSLPSKWLTHIKVDDDYPIFIHQLKKEVIGTVSHIINKTNSDTQTATIKLDLQSKPLINSGLSGVINFRVGEEQQILIPITTLVTMAGVKGVFRIDKDNQVKFTPVQTGRKWKGKFVVLSGLEINDRVITNPDDNIRDSSQIKQVTLL